MTRHVRNDILKLCVTLNIFYFSVYIASAKFKSKVKFNGLSLLPATIECLHFPRINTVVVAPRVEIQNVSLFSGGNGATKILIFHLKLPHDRV